MHKLRRWALLEIEAALLYCMHPQVRGVEKQISNVSSNKPRNTKVCDKGHVGDHLPLAPLPLPSPPPTVSDCAEAGCCPESCPAHTAGVLPSWEHTHPT